MTALHVNGVERDLDVGAGVPLLWVLRDQVGLASPKYGCGVEQCGACRVLVDGAPVASCRMPWRDAAGHDVATLEQLRNEPEGAEVLDALIGASAAQCGYCLPGIAVTLVWLARRRPVPWTEVVRALDDHLCRCGSQPRILRVAGKLFDHPTDS